MSYEDRNAAETRVPRGMGPGGKIGIVVALVIVVGGIFWIRNRSCDPNVTLSSDSGQVEAAAISGTQATQPSQTASGKTSAVNEKLPRLVDVGAGKCIPCKKMAPILDELKKEFAGRLDVEFVDVWVNPKAGDPYKIRLIPTQIFYDASGKERFRHEGFYSREDILGKWKELGVDLTGKPVAAIERAVPTTADARSKDSICFMCDGDVSPKTRVLVKGQAEQVILCSPHCFFIYHSSLKEPAKAEAITSVTDAASGNLIPATTATYLYGLDPKGRPTVMAFADKEAATK